MIPVVYTMGKVASSSISQAIKRAGLPYYDIHSLDRDYLLSYARRCIEAGNFPPPHVCTSMAWRDLEIIQKQKCLYITLVREPIARNLSAYFQNLEYFNAAEGNDADRVFAHFLKEYHHDVPVSWLDREFGKQLGIDVYAKEFDKIRRYTILENAVIFRVDCPDETKSSVLSDLLGEQILVGRDNDSSNKVYRNLYSRVKDSAIFDLEYIRWMYSSKYARHFWTDDELSEMTGFWLRTKSTAVQVD